MRTNHFPFLMKSFAVCTSFLTLLFTITYCLFPINDLLVCVITFGTTAYHFIMRLAVGYIVPKLTKYDFDYRCRWFQPRAWESAFYKKLNIKHWKKKIPTYDPVQFSIKENSLHSIIQNMCGAEIVHEIIMILSFAPVLMVPLFGAFPVFLITSVLAALFDGIFVMAQRYNRPRLVRIYEKQEEQAYE